MGMPLGHLSSPFSFLPPSHPPRGTSAPVPLNQGSWTQLKAGNVQVPVQPPDQPCDLGQVSLPGLHL